MPRRAARLNGRGSGSRISLLRNCTARAHPTRSSRRHCGGLVFHRAGRWHTVELRCFGAAADPTHRVPKSEFLPPLPRDPATTVSRIVLDIFVAPPERIGSMKTIGIIGGSTDIATVEYYKLINEHVRQALGGLHTGEIIINSMDLAWSAHYVNNQLWDEGAAYLRGKALGLERAGADFIICVSNTWHRVADKFMAGINIPLLHIAEPTSKAIQEKGLKNVALLGTKATMSSPYLPELFSARYGLVITVPTEKQQDLIDGVIFGEISYGQFTEASRKAYLEIIDDLVARGAQGVILGCTEIPLLVSQADRPEIPMFDTLRLHAKAAAMMAAHE